MPHSFSPTLIIDGTLYILLVFSIITWTLIIYKAWEFSRNNYYNRIFDAAFWESVDNSMAKLLTLDNTRGSLARIALCGFNWLEEIQRPGVKTIRFQSLSPQELLEQALRIQIQKELRRIEGGLTLLASIGSTAPFVGLFGTVFGIMRAMQDISKSGSASLDVVAGPIGDALIATAVGIAVAVPAVLAYNFFQRRSKLQRLSMENFADGFMHIAFTNTKPKQV
ncbi:MAG: MotA/TolQ/ExbB proton channel family protein [Methylococcales bacterium]|nr:MotA/TolQ/ExbB proton channel family protein [Methylococcales bacterium]